MADQLNDKPIWLSTAGLGVPWLHVRLNRQAKYAVHQRYRQAVYLPSRFWAASGVARIERQCDKITAMSEEPSRPWTEAEWERFIRQSEARSARAMELMETLYKEGADEDQIERRLCREMGWPEPDSSANEVNQGSGDAMSFDQANDELASDAGESSPDEAETPPGYDLAYAVGLEVMRTLQGVDHSQTSDQTHERLRSAMEHALIPAAKLRGGHAMGYDDEVLAGHIVYCRIALKAAAAAKEDVQWLTDRGVMASSGSLLL
jgi:hypothetical protein